MERLAEHNSYITIKASKLGLSPSDLESVWDTSVVQQKQETPEITETDPMFTRKVMDRFDQKVDMIHIEKARSIVMAREDTTRSGQDWINSIAENNYVKANEAFPKFVKASYESLLGSKSKEFLAKFAEKIKNSDKQQQ
jgi:hypothetical protein